MNSAPNIVPNERTEPAEGGPHQKVIETAGRNESALTEPTSIATSAPATPAYAADNPNASVLKIAGLRPEDTAASSASRTARNDRPNFPLSRNQAKSNSPSAMPHAW